MSGSERRLHLRYPIGTIGSNPIVATVGVIPRAAILDNLSLGGVCLLMINPPPLDCIVPVWLALPIGAPSQLVLLRVVHVCKLENDLHRLGLTCLDDTGRELLRGLVAVLRNGDSSQSNFNATA